MELIYKMVLFLDKLIIILVPICILSQFYIFVFKDSSSVWYYTKVSPLLCISVFVKLCICEVVYLCICQVCVLNSPVCDIILRCRRSSWQHVSVTSQSGSVQKNFSQKSVKKVCDIAARDFMSVRHLKVTICQASSGEGKLLIMRKFWESANL